MRKVGRKRKYKVATSMVLALVGLESPPPSGLSRALSRAASLAAAAAMLCNRLHGEHKAQRAHRAKTSHSADEKKTRIR